MQQFAQCPASLRSSLLAMSFVDGNNNDVDVQIMCKHLKVQQVTYNSSVEKPEEEVQISGTPGVQRAPMISFKVSNSLAKYMVSDQAT